MHPRLASVYMTALAAQTADDAKLHPLTDETIDHVALGGWTMERLAQGLRQLMAGSRKFSVEHLSRDDIAALSREAADISGIHYVMDVDKAQVNTILNS